MQKKDGKALGKCSLEGPTLVQFRLNPSQLKNLYLNFVFFGVIIDNRLKNFEITISKIS